MFVYALICSTFDVEITSKVRKLFEFLKNYKNYFDSKHAKVLFEHENENHIIDLILDAELPYELFYTLFETELDVLKYYLVKNLLLSRI